jgi:heme A synthase
MTEILLIVRFSFFISIEKTMEGVTAEPLNASPPWLHGWAIFTVCATLAGLTLGAMVTTFRVGMADPIWPTYPWHLLLVPREQLSAGLLIEHGHRAASYLVGLCIIVLAAGLWLQEPRRWLRWLGTGALLGVILQGVLGGFRVKLNELVGTDLATVHGCFAQLVFALLVSLVVFTSRSWSTATQMEAPVEVRRWSLYVVGLVYLQIVLGAILRHTYSRLAQRGHILVAFAVVAATAWLLKLALDKSLASSRSPGVFSAVRWLAVLVFIQILFGVEAFLLRFAAGVAPQVQQLTTGQAIVRTAHVLIGFLVLAASVVVVLRAHRRWAGGLKLATVPAQQLRGAV